MKPFNRCVLSLAIGLLACAASVTHGAAPPWPAQVAAPSSHRIKFTSAINGDSYTLMIRVPLTPPPPQGHPVIYVLDGDFWFGTASDIAMSLGDPARWPVVVAIGHGVFDDMEVVARYAPRRAGDATPLHLGDMAMANNLLRFQDYTLPVAAAHRAPAWTGLTPANVGGVDKFLDVIDKEIKPKIAELVKVNTDNQALFGHSIGGLAVLRALFTRPSAYRTFVAASPAIWWDADAVLKDEPGFGERIQKQTSGPRVLLTVGANEPESPNPPQQFIDSLPPERAAELTAYVKMAGQWSGMVSGARNLADRLGKVAGPPTYKVSFVAFAGESHSSTIPAALSRGLQFAFQDQ